MNDTVPPIAVCDAGLIATMPAQATSFILWATDIDGGSFDACSGMNLNLLIGLNEVPGQIPDTNFLELTGPGTYILSLWVGDEAGNWNTCWTEFTLLAAENAELVSGQVFIDEDESCSPSAGEAGLSGWLRDAASAASARL